MAQLDNHTQLKYATLLQDMLRLIVFSPEFSSVVPEILRETVTLTQADAGFFMVFEDPYVVYVNGITEATLPQAARLQELLDGLAYKLHLIRELPAPLSDTYAVCGLVPILHSDKIAGVFGLVFERDVELQDDVVSFVMSLLDGISIVTNFEKSSARHSKLTRNQNEFVRIVSHDLRSPLTSIKGFASMLESSEQDERKLHFVEKILNGVTQMTYLVDNIQDAGRYDPETGFYEMERSPTDLVAMVREIANKHLVPAEKEELALEVNIADDVPIVNVDSNMIERSIINLVDNAIKYTPNGGRVEVGVRKNDEHLLITISDNGLGISEDNKRQLFNRHFRIRRREHARVKGSGLGLFIVRSVARHHDGDAFVESTEGQGSTFGIRIPLAGENLLGGSQS